MRILKVFSFVLLSCIAAPAVSQERTGAPPLDLLFQSYVDYGFQFSPDGNYLAFITREAPYYYLIITDLKQVKVIFKHRLSTYEMPVQNVYWLSNNRLLYESVGRVMAINIDGTEHKTLISYYHEVKKITSLYRYFKSRKQWEIVNLLPEDDEEILVRSVDTYGYMHIHRINVYTGEKTDIINGKNWRIQQWYTDLNGEVRLGVREDDGEAEIFMVSFKDDKDAVLTPVKFENGKYKVVIKGDSFFDQQVAIASFSSDPNVIYLCENINSDRYRLVTFDLAKDRFLETIAEDDTYDICGPAVSMLPMFHDRGTTLVGILYERDKPGTLWLDDRFRKIQQTIDRKYGHKTNIIQTWTQDLSKVLFYSYNEENLGRVYIYYPHEKKMALQSYLAPELENFRMGKTGIVRYKARDGHSIEAYLTLPPDVAPRALPLVVMPHGGPVIRDSWGYNPYVQAFATRGYAVLQPNFRGSPGYGRNHLKSGFNELAALMVDDVADGAREMIRAGTADQSRVFIFGQSYGGYAAIMSAIRYHDLYKAGVSVAAPLDMVKQISSHKKNDQYFAYDFWRTLAGDPRKEAEILRKISPYYRVEEIKIPLLLFHGSDDPIIDAEQVRDFEKIKDRAPAVIRTMIFKNEGHGFAVQSNNAYHLEKALEHFANNLVQEAKNDPE